MKTHDEPVPFTGDDIDHELIFQMARVDRHERLDDPAVRVRNDEVRKALAGPLNRRESRDEELAPPLRGADVIGGAVSCGQLFLSWPTHGNSPWLGTKSRVGRAVTDAADPRRYPDRVECSELSC